MGGHHFQEIPCKVCSQPVDLQADLCADENGQAIHEDCYVKRVTGYNGNSAANVSAD